MGRSSTRTTLHNGYSSVPLLESTRPYTRNGCALSGPITPDGCLVHRSDAYGRSFGGPRGYCKTVNVKVRR